MRICKICSNNLAPHHKSVCSHECRTEWVSKLNKEAGRKPPSRKGCKISERVKQKLRKAHKKRVEDGKHNMHDPECVAKVMASKKKLYDKRGRRSKERELAKRSKKYQNWRKAVFERDDYTCQHCGERGGELNADHIKPYSLYENLRYELSNGRTLCAPCHRKTPTYGVRAWREMSRSK